MIRLAVLLMLLAAPAVAQTMQPVPRPDGLGLRRGPAVEVHEELDRAAIAEQISRAIRACWNVSGLSEEATAVRIWLAFNTTPEGGILRDTIEMIEFSNGTQDAADEALGPAFRAIMRCGDTGLELPPETHSIWQRVEMQFDAASVVAQ